MVLRMQGAAPSANRDHAERCPSTRAPLLWLHARHASVYSAPRPRDLTDLRKPPIRITETGGGTADWNCARIATSLAGAEVERYELGADVSSAAGFSRISPRSNELYGVTFRLNSADIDRVDITLGFGDIRDGRVFEVEVPFGSFSGVNISLTPLSVPPEGAVRLGKN